MSAERIQYEFSMQLFEILKAQDPENGYFDVAFEIQGKKLYAHKSKLCPVSSSFKSMLSNQLTIYDKPILIEGYSFENFKEFLTFLYSGKCQLSKENIFSMVDIAEFYRVPCFKTICDEFLTKTELTLENIYQMIRISNKYSLTEFYQLVVSFASKNISTFLKNEQFYGLEKCTLIKILELSDKTKNQEVIFEAVYKWVEKQANKNLETDNFFFFGLDLNDAIKKQISDLLPFISFQNMSVDFLTFFVVKQTDIFTNNELRDILCARSGVHVQITDENGKKMKGELRCDEMERVVDVIKSLNDKCCRFDFVLYYWRTTRQKPSTPSKLIKNEKIDWYLVYDFNGDIAIKTRNKSDDESDEEEIDDDESDDDKSDDDEFDDDESDYDEYDDGEYDDEESGDDELYCDESDEEEIDNDEDYLLAEMFAEDGFVLSTKCKIEIV
uniref:BTB domain-containing protein n=1 Tax=Panagrolaimus sp. PS1159 TaxID=55785 RepID=A0AC35GXJ6_9BILA